MQAPVQKFAQGLQDRARQRLQMRTTAAMDVTLPSVEDDSYEPETLLPSKQLSNTKQGKPRKKDALEQRQEQPHDTQIADQEELVPFHLSDDEEEEDGSHENLLKRKQPQPSMMQKARSTKKKMRGN
jgi:hypothetical protein